MLPITNMRKILHSTASYIGKEISSRRNLNLDDLKRLVPARYVLDENGNVFLEKILNGEVVERARVGDKEWWERVNKYRTNLRFKPTNPIEHSSCPLSCGLCSAHQNATALLNIVLTNRCNLNCFYCFFYAEKAGYVYEPSLEEIVKMVRSAKRFNNGKLYAVQLTGGEPTLREDLPEIIRRIKEEGIQHIQLNTNAVRFGIMYYNNPERAKSYVKELREAGLNTIYMSFDGVSKEKNFKNHFETPFALEAFKEGDLRSVVLVPTLINGWNFPEEVDKIVKFAAINMDVVRGVNFQPVSFVGYMTEEEIEDVEKKRVTQSDLEIALSQKLNIPRNSWRPIPYVLPFLVLLGKEDLGFYNNPLCGEATYVIVEREGNNIKFHPITEFIDIDSLYNDLEEILRGNRIQRFLSRMKIMSKLLSKSYIIRDELPDGTKLSELIENLIRRKDYGSAGELHYKLLFLGSMHFMDPFNYDIQRVMRCSIHYASPDGRVIPFCAYNVFPQIYRDAIFKEYSLPEDIARKKIEETKKFYREIAEFRSKENLERVRNNPIYVRRYNIPN